MGGALAWGVVARAAKDILFGYFFEPPLADDEESQIDGLTPKTAILAARFSAMGLVSGEWKVIGQIQKWNRSLWPLPDFVRYDPLGIIKPRLIRYSEDDLATSEDLGVAAKPDNLLRDSLFSSGAVEITLAKTLSNDSRR